MSEKYCVRGLFTATKIPPEDLPDLLVLSFLGGLRAMISKPGISFNSEPQISDIIKTSLS